MKKLAVALALLALLSVAWDYPPQEKARQRYYNDVHRWNVAGFEFYGTVGHYNNINGRVLFSGCRDKIECFTLASRAVFEEGLR